MRVFISGATGFFANALGLYLKNSDPCYQIIGISRRQVEQSESYDEQLTYDRFFDSTELHEEDIFVHAAFARKTKGKDLYESLDLSYKLFSFCLEKRISAIVNISSQGVYGDRAGMFITEKDAPAPADIYSSGKLASEFILRSLKSAYDTTAITNIRLASLMGCIGSQLQDNIISKMIISAIEDDIIMVEGGDQLFSFLDVRDACSAIGHLLSIPNIDWKQIYNVTPDSQLSILELANVIAICVGDRFHRDPAPIVVKQKETSFAAGASNRLFKSDVCWTPDYGVYDYVTTTLNCLEPLLVNEVSNG
jgi:nucleoside-diphosphate-sugar epimerase